jgi:GYF domain 2
MNLRANQWYLSRNGQQHGPFSDADVANFARLGQLQVNDLIWREGFANWRPALTIFPEPLPASAPYPTRRTVAAQVDVPRRQPIGSLPRRGPTWKVVLIALATSAVIGAISGYAYRYALTRAAEPMQRSGDTVRGAAPRIVGSPTIGAATAPS